MQLERLLLNIETLVTRSRNIEEIDAHVTVAILHHRRWHLQSTLRENIELVLQSGERTMTTFNLLEKNVLVHSMYRRWFRGGKHRKGYVPTTINSNPLWLSKADNLRILRLPIITFSLFPWPSSQNIFSWLTAKKLILCRYDFFPELMLYGGRSDVVFILLSATLKNKKIHGLRGIFCREIFNFFKLIVSATDRDADRFMELGIEQKKISVFDFRVIQIMDRMKNAGSVLKKWDFFEDYNGYLDGFSMDSRLLFGSAWPSEMGVFKNHEFIKCIMDGKISVTIAPHKLGKGFIDEIINSIKKFANDPLLEIYHLSGDMNSDEIRELFLNLKKKPGILVSSVPGILCELYSLHGNVFVGGGHGRSIHSVLEPYLAMANVFCGPKVHRSTEYDFILDNSPDFITIVFEIDKFYEIFNERYQKVIDSGKRKKLMTGFDVQFIDVYRKILGKGCDLYA